MREQASNLLFGVLDKMYKDALLAQEQKKTRIATSGTDKKETQPLVSEDKSEDSKLTETTTTTPTEQPKTDAPQPKETQPTQMQSQSQPKNQTSSTESKTEQSDEIPTSGMFVAVLSPLFQTDHFNEITTLIPQQHVYTKNL
jgi:cell division septation protein DedD